MLRQKSGRPNALDYEKPFMVQKFRNVCRALADLQDPGVNEYKLASLTCQLQQYMEDHFGRYSPKPRLMTRLPASAFRDYSDNGKLALILRTSIQYKLDNGWTEIEFKNPDMQEDIHGMFLLIEAELKERSFLKYPHIYFAPSVAPELKASLGRIVEAHGGSVVSQDDATHVVEFNQEVDGGGTNEIEADYLRTLEVRPDMGLAWVHWWYFPDSHDEWIALPDVQGQPPDDDVHRRPKQWRVCCRFVRDVAVFNEWGCELDYEIDEPVVEDVKKKTATKSKRAEEVARKRKEGILPEFIETTANVMAELPRPSENPNISKLRIVELHNDNRLSSNGNDDDDDDDDDDGYDTQTRTHETSPSKRNGDDDGSEESESVLPMEEDTFSSKPVRKRPASPTRSNPKNPSMPVHTYTQEQARKRFRPSPLLAQGGALGSPLSAPSWLNPTAVSSVEARLLPEFFTNTSRHKTAEKYLELRNSIINLYKKQPEQYLSATAARRSLAGDVCAIIRVHEFLDAFNIINHHPRASSERPRDLHPSISQVYTHTHGDSYPQGYFGPSQSMALSALYSTGYIMQQKQQEAYWTTERDGALLDAITRYGEDWDAVASHVSSIGSKSGCEEDQQESSETRLTASECVLRFCTLPIAPPVAKNSYPEPSITPIPGAKGTGDALFKLCDGGDISRLLWHAKIMSQPSALQAAVKAAWDVISNKDSKDDVSLLAQTAQRAAVTGVLGLAGAEARNELQREKAAMSEVMDDYIVVRLQALEAKMKLVSEMQDWCGDEQEKIELEYRDLKIQRARAGLPAQHLGATQPPK